MSGLHRVGLLGGMTWQSTANYYRLLNEAVHERVGGSASAPVTIHSVDFGDIEPRQRAGDWAGQGRILAKAAASLEAGGAEAIALATRHPAPGGRRHPRRRSPFPSSTSSTWSPMPSPTTTRSGC